MMIASTYQVHTHLEQGEMTSAYHISHRLTNEHFLLVLLHLPHGDSMGYHRVLHRCETTMAQLVALPPHPGLLSPHEAGEWQGFPFLLYPTTGLTSRPLQWALPLPLSHERVLFFAFHLAKTLDHVHTQGIVHGSVLPHMIRFQSGALLPLLAGCGLYDLLQAEPGMPYSHLRNHWGRFLSHPAFLAPERLLGFPASPATDLYELGCLMYYWLTGMPPGWSAERVGPSSYLSMVSHALRHPLATQIPDDWPSGIASLLRYLGAHKPSHRLQSMQELVQACAALLTSDPLHPLADEEKKSL